MELAVMGSDTKVSVSEQAFGKEFNAPLVHQVVTAYLSGGRAGTKAQKNRSAVRGGGTKPWRQKGTGRARAGSIRSPLWRGGGTIFAAQPRNYGQKVNKKMYRAAMCSIFSELARQGRLVVGDPLRLEQPKTRDLAIQLRDQGLDSVLIVTEKKDRNLELASRNLHKVSLCTVDALDPVSLVRHDRVLVTEDVVKRIEDWLT